MVDTVILQVIGIIYVAVSFAFWVNPKFPKKLIESFSENAALLFISGMIALVIGYALIISHGVIFVGLNQIVVVALGWMIFLKGLFLLALPELAISLLKNLAKSKKLTHFMGMIAPVIAVFCLWFGFFVK